jgi:hypothetical protein
MADAVALPALEQISPHARVFYCEPVAAAVRMKRA